jgi:hypothetical protein
VGKTIAMNKKLATLALVLLCAATLAGMQPAAAQSVGAGAAFSKGRTHLVISGGTGYAFDDTYFVIGAGASYYVIDGLSVGLGLEYWSSGSPTMYKVTPSVTYVFYKVPTVKPYVGAFYRRAYIDGLPDLNSAGGRAGAYVEAGRNTYVSLGAVYETYLDCKTSIYRKCENTYLELGVTFAF